LANEMLEVFWRQPITERYATENPFSTYQNFYLAYIYFLNV
jgi:ATP/ADP translocase